MAIDLEQKIVISLKDLLDFARLYDGEGKNEYLESQYEGQMVIYGLVAHVLGKEISVEFINLFEY